MPVKRITSLEYYTLGIFLSSVLVAGMSLPSSGSPSLPTQIHLSWRDPSSQVVNVTWATKAPTLNPTVEFGFAESVLLFQRPAETFTLPMAPGTQFYSVQLGPFTPGGAYQYRVGDQDGGWSAVYRYSHSSPSEPFTFVAAADMGVNPGAAASAARMAEIRPAFSLIIGDLAYAHGHQVRWDAWINQMQPVAATAPMMAVPGNHEHTGKLELESYLGRLVLPGDERNYSFVCGNALMVGLDSGRYYDKPIPELAAWLERELAIASVNRDIKWIVVFFHFPPFGTGPAGPWKEGRETLSPILDRFGVDLVLNGHQHSYERSWPVLADGSVPERNYKNPQGPVYVITGGSGGPDLTGYDPSLPPWSAFRASENEVLKVTVGESQLAVEAVRPDGSLLDSFTLEKTTTW